MKISSGFTAILQTLRLPQRPILSRIWKKEIPYDITRREINGKVVKLFCTKEDIFYAAYLRKEGEDIVHRVEKSIAWLPNS